MNSSCPNCGAVYNVTQKDVGRRIKCKKCSTPLIVTDAGLEVDQPAGAAAPAGREGRDSREPDDTFDTRDEDEGVSPRRGKGGRKYAAGPSIDVMQVFKDFGGISAVLFGFGAFLVIVFMFLPIIGDAAVDRAQGAVERIDLEWKSKERQMRKSSPPKTEEEINTARDKFYKDNDKDKAQENVDYERTSNKRAKWLERYGMMFGFIVLMFGSLGFMMPGQTQARRVLGTIVLAAQLVFLIFEVVLVSGITSFAK